MSSLNTEREHRQHDEAEQGDPLVGPPRRRGRLGVLGLEHRVGALANLLRTLALRGRLRVAEDLRALLRARHIDVNFRGGNHSHLLREQLASAHREEQQYRHGEVHAEAGEHGCQLVQRQAGFLDDAVGDAAVDADRREAAPLRTVHHEEPHQQGADLVLEGKAQRDRRDDRHRRRADRADCGERRGNEEHDPRNRRHPSPDRPHRAPDQPVDRAVVLGQCEEIRDPDQRQKQLTGEETDDRLGAEASQQGSDQKGADEGEHAHIDRQSGGNHEHRHQRVDGNQLRSHGAYASTILNTALLAEDKRRPAQAGSEHMRCFMELLLLVKSRPAGRGLLHRPTPRGTAHPFRTATSPASPVLLRAAARRWPPSRAADA